MEKSKELTLTDEELKAKREEEVETLRKELGKKPPKDAKWEVVYGNDAEIPGLAYLNAGVSSRTEISLGNVTVIVIARRKEMPDACGQDNLFPPRACPFKADENGKPSRYCDCIAGHVQREIHRRAEDEALRRNFSEGRLGKWVKESDDVYHYFRDVRDADDDVGRVVLLGDVMVDRGSKDFGGGDRLWYAVMLNSEDMEDGLDTGNFCELADAKEWVEKEVARRSKV